MPPSVAWCEHATPALKVAGERSYGGIGWAGDRFMPQGAPLQAELFD